MDNNAMFNISYGLYVLTAKEGEKDNGCMINTLLQVTSSPNRVSVTVNKQNLTHDMILSTGAFNVSMLTEETPFELIKHFGFQSGKTVNKFEKAPLRAENGIAYVSESTNAYLSGKVVSTTDLGTHTMFIADVTDAKILSASPSLTYTYYQKNIKPAPAPVPKGVKGYRCKICGYIYEGDPLPADFICPICKHGAIDFEPIF